RCMPVWNGQTLTFVQDRPSDKVWTYNRSNVVMPDDGAPFRYSFSALKDRHNAVEVNWIDPNNGWETATELVEDTQAIARYGRNVTKMDAFGCTSRGQAHRAGLWLIKTELLETQTVDFSVGAEGLRHVPGDVIEICDDDYAGIRTGGRVLAVNIQTRTLTLDREITLPSSGTTLISLVDGQGSPVSVEVQSVTDGVKVKVSRVPDGVAEYSVWGLKLPTLRQRLFRCVSIRENDDGTYAITAVQHVPSARKVNGKALSADITLTPKDIGTLNSTTMSFSGGAGWFKLATVTMPQASSIVYIALIGGAGYNVGSPHQAGISELVLRAGNGNPKGITGALWKRTAVGLTNFAWINTSGDTYDIYVEIGNYATSVNIHWDCTANASVSVYTSPTYSASKPSSVTYGVVYTMYSTHQKPTPLDIGALPTTGGTVSGPLSVTGGLTGSLNGNA
ncbi:phage tail protein, partial [Escherichia coli]|uniref:phage tail protein n=1 Tax=Escherichia coli TaxID=562 RepID=UPI003D21EA8C